jgi:hypothetical protein
LTSVCFSTVPTDFFAFSHGFQHKKFTFTARPLAHRSACQSATYTNAGQISQKFGFMLPQSGKIINSAPLKIPEVLYERFKRISQKVLT